MLHPARGHIPEVPRFAVEGLREHTHHLLLWQARGSSSFATGDISLELAEGSAVWIPAGTEHRFSTSPDSAILPMFFDLRRHASPSDGPSPVTIDTAAETLCLALIASQYSLVRTGTGLEEKVIELVATQIAVPLDVVLPHSGPALRVARATLLDPADPRTLADWATDLHVSTRTLERQFAAETGTGWTRWRHGYRMLRAERLLTTTPLDITAIARMVGFTSPSSFTRAFREHRGLPPARYRETAA